MNNFFFFLSFPSHQLSSLISWKFLDGPASSHRQYWPGLGPAMIQCRSRLSILTYRREQFKPHRTSHTLNTEGIVKSMSVLLVLPSWQVDDGRSLLYRVVLCGKMVFSGGLWLA